MLMDNRIVELVAAQVSYLVVESVRGADGFGITVSYWLNLEFIALGDLIRWLQHFSSRQTIDQPLALGGVYIRLVRLGSESAWCIW